MPGFEILPSNLVGTLRLDLALYLANGGSCPTPANPTQELGMTTTTTSTTQNIAPPVAGFKSGFYYRTPISSQTTLDDQPQSKYHFDFTLPYVAFVYPSTSILSGLMLVKSSAPLSTIPNDVTQISESEVIADLATYVQNIFVL